MTERERPASRTPLTDDPTAPNDGLDPGEENVTPQARRHHGAVDDPTHPDFHTTGHRFLPHGTDLAGMPERTLVVDEHSSQTAGPGAATQAQLGGRPPLPGSTDPDAPGDPRADRPGAEPDST